MWLNMRFTTKLITRSNLNSREHYRVKAKRGAAERAKLKDSILAAISHEQPCFISDGKLNQPVIVKVTRVAPSNGLDRDNLWGAGKFAIDGITDGLGLDNDRDQRLEWEMSQRKCTKREGYSVEVEVQPYRVLRVPGNGDVVALLSSKLTSTQVKDLGIPRLVGGRVRLECQGTIVDVLLTIP